MTGGGGGGPKEEEGEEEERTMGVEEDYVVASRRRRKKGRTPWTGSIPLQENSPTNMLRMFTRLRNTIRFI